jgi:ABC-type amino acid transport system permease subunit
MTAHAAVRKPSERLASLKSSATVEMTDRVRQARAAGRKVIGLSSGDPNIATDPRIIAAAERALHRGDTHYATPAGQPELLPAFACAVLGLSIYSAAYVAEIVRAGIGSVPPGQFQAALAGGLTGFQTLRLIVYPQALHIVAPSLASLMSQLIKDSSLASVIAVADLTYQAGAIEGQTFRTFEVYITISLLYLLLVTLVSRLVMAWAGEDTTARLSDA